MKKKTTAFGLSPEKISNLLKICAEFLKKDVAMETENNITELLQDRLSETLLTGSLKDSSLSKELTHLCHISGIAAGESIRKLLSNPATDIQLMNKIKEHGKTLSQNSKTQAEHDTANVIYYAAIAHASVCHNLKITKFSYDELAKSFSVFIQKEWVSKDLSELFSKAMECCKGHNKQQRKML